MKRQQIKVLLMVFTILLSTLYILIGNKIATKNLDHFKGKDLTSIKKAKVVEIVDHSVEKIPLDGGDPMLIETITFLAKDLSDKKSTEMLLSEQNINTYMLIQLKPVEVGDTVILYNIPNEALGTDWALSEYVRTDSLIVLAIVFVILLLIFGRKQGLQTIVSLVYTILAIFLVFIPSILSGKNIYFWSVLTCVYIIFMTFLIISGYNKKSLVAGIGCFGGIMVSGLLTRFMDNFLKLTGLVDQDSAYLMFINPDNPIDLKAIIFAAIIIGALGAIMDVSMSIASSLHEIKLHTEKISFKKLIVSGMRIGRDIMGTMSNTLILAYIGGSLGIVLLLISYNSSIFDILNREMVVVEILQALVGSFGILFTIPLTAIASGIFYQHK